MKRFRKRTSAFTLLELLVVVIVIGILGTLALPRFARYSAKARSAEAINTIGSILTAEWIYYQENTAFTSDTTKLLVIYPTTNFGYALGEAKGVFTVTADGVGNSVGIQVVGTIDTTGARTLKTTKLP